MRIREIIFALLIPICLLTNCRCSNEKPNSNVITESSFGGKETFALVYTSNMYGWVEPCGCTSQPLGGISRLATIVKSARDHFGMGTVFIDGGNLLFSSEKSISPMDACQEKARVDLLLRSLKQLGVEGTFSQKFDETMGTEFRDQVYAKHQISDLSETGKNGFVTGSEKFKLGIIALNEVGNDSNSIAVRLKKDGADAVVAFSYLSRAQSKEVAKSSSEIDVVILVADSEDSPPPAELPQLNGPVLVSTGRQGQHAGLIEFHLKERNSSLKTWKFEKREQEKEGRIKLVSERKKSLEKEIAATVDSKQLEFLKGRLYDAQSELEQLKLAAPLKPIAENFIVAKTIAISRAIPVTPVIDEWLKDYESKIPSLVALCEADVECPKPSMDEPHFVGAMSCKNCHAKAYDVWQNAVHEVPAADEQGNQLMVKSGHSKAWLTLELKKKTEDRTCIGCHSVGFMQPGGYCKVKEVAELKNVQCESCHGAGSQHVQTGDRRFIKREVPESVCRGCHQVPHISSPESFVYSDKVQKILGDGHGEMLLLKIKHDKPKTSPENIR